MEKTPRPVALPKGATSWRPSCCCCCCCRYAFAQKKPCCCRYVSTVLSQKKLQA